MARTEDNTEKLRSLRSLGNVGRHSLMGPQGSQLVCMGLGISHGGSCKAAFWGVKAPKPVSSRDSAVVSSVSVHRWPHTAASWPAWRTSEWGCK